MTKSQHTVPLCASLNNPSSGWSGPRWEIQACTKTTQDLGDFRYLLKWCWYEIWTQTPMYDNGIFEHKIQKGIWKTPIEYSNLVCYFLWLLSFEHQHHDHLKHIITSFIPFFLILKCTQLYYTSHNKWVRSCVVLLVLFTTNVQQSQLCAYVFDTTKINYLFTIRICNVTGFHQESVWAALKSEQ